MQQPFLAVDEQANAPEGKGANKSNRLRGGAESFGKSCFQCVISLIILGAILATALSRNRNCDFEALKDIDPPYGGELLPANVRLIERRTWFQLTKFVDAYDLDHNHIGYFYDMNFLFFMRFGFSDAADRIWFEARYPSWTSRFKFNLEYSLQRCDVGTATTRGRLGGVYDVKEDWWARKWFCFNNCVRVFHVKRADANSAGGVQTSAPVATALFNSTLYWSGWQNRHAWYMNLTDSSTDSVIAWAQQHFQRGGPIGLSLLSNWTVDVKQEKPYLPNWVITFMAALDDIEEEK